MMHRERQFDRARRLSEENPGDPMWQWRALRDRDALSYEDERILVNLVIEKAIRRGERVLVPVVEGLVSEEGACLLRNGMPAMRTNDPGILVELGSFYMIWWRFWDRSFVCGVDIKVDCSPGDYEHEPMTSLPIRVLEGAIPVPQIHHRKHDILDFLRSTNGLILDHLERQQDGAWLMLADRIKASDGYREWCSEVCGG